MGSNIIRNLSKVARVVRFSGLPKIGSCSPSDIDLCVEVRKLKKYMVCDLKEYGKCFADPVDGQEILLRAHVDAFRTAGYDAVAILAWHEQELEVIDAAKAVVAQFYRGQRWTTPPEREPLLEWYCRFFGVDKPEERVIAIIGPTSAPATAEELPLFDPEDLMQHGFW
jgi:hypothetical protein